MRALLDVNVLIALLDAAHQHHRLAWQWFETHIEAGWASCPLTQNGYVRIVSQPNYPNRTSTFDAITRLRGATGAPQHVFWADSLSLLDPTVVDAERVHGPRQLTDLYLLALAVAHDGRLVSFDHAIARSAVPGAEARHLLLI